MTETLFADRKTFFLWMRMAYEDPSACNLGNVSWFMHAEDLDGEVMFRVLMAAVRTGRWTPTKKSGAQLDYAGYISTLRTGCPAGTSRMNGFPFIGAPGGVV
jgi:hypothetical protein